MQNLNDLAVFFEEVSVGDPFGIDADNIGVVECRVRHATGELIVKDPIRGNKPLRQWSVHDQ